MSGSPQDYRVEPRSFDQRLPLLRRITVLPAGIHPVLGAPTPSNVQTRLPSPCRAVQPRRRPCRWILLRSVTWWLRDAWTLSCTASSETPSQSEGSRRRGLRWSSRTRAGGIETVYAFLVNAFDTGGVSVDEYDACHPLFEESPCPGVLKTTELNPGASIRGYVYFVESPYYPLEFIQFSEPHTFERTDKIAVPVPSRPARPTPVPLDSPALGDVVASGRVDAVVYSIERDAFTVGGVSTTRIEVEFTNTRGGIETVYAFLVNCVRLREGWSVDEYDVCHPLFEESPCPGVLITTELNPGASIRGYVYFVESPYYPLEFIQFSEPHTFERTDKIAVPTP